MSTLLPPPPKFNDEIDGWMFKLWKRVLDALAISGGSSLPDPGSDSILFWDDSSGTLAWLTLGTGIAISGTTLYITGDLSNIISDAQTMVANSSRVYSTILTITGTGSLTIPSTSYVSIVG